MNHVQKTIGFHIIIEKIKNKKVGIEVFKRFIISYKNIIMFSFFFEDLQNLSFITI